MAELEEEFLDQQTFKPRVWIRFIDDIFMIWNHNLEALEEFITNLNDFHLSIKFTKEMSEFELPFLDTFVYKEDGKLQTKVCHKPTDNKQYLLYTSCHPTQHRNSIPYSLLVRAKRICTKDMDFITEAKSIVRTLRKRKYPEDIFQKAVERIMSKEEIFYSPKRGKRIPE